MKILSVPITGIDWNIVLFYVLGEIGWILIMCDIAGFAHDFYCKEKVFCAKDREK